MDRIVQFMAHVTNRTWKTAKYVYIGTRFEWNYLSLLILNEINSLGLEPV